MLAGVLSQVTAYAPFPFVHDYLDVAQSDLAAVLAVRAVDGVLLLAPLVYLLVPALVVFGAPDDGDRRQLVLAVAALLVVPALALALQLLAGPRLRDVAIVVAVSLLLVVGLLALRRFGERVDGTLPASAATLGVVFAGLLLVSAFAGGFAGARVADGLSESYSAWPPQAAFAFEYEPVDDERGVLVVQHDGGLGIPVEELSLHPEPNGSFVAVAGANQTDAGRWRGSTTPGDGGPLVAPGDAVAAGLPADCESVRVVWDDGDDTATIGHYGCPGGSA